MRWCSSAACLLVSLGATACRQAVDVGGYTFFAECIPGTTTECYSGPAETQGVGACRAGARVCLDDGTGFGPCDGEIPPKELDDCATATDTTCDGDVPVKCTGEPKWARTIAETEGTAVAAVGGSNAEPLVELAAAATIQPDDPCGSPVAGSFQLLYEADGDVWSSTFTGQVTRSIVVAADDVYTAGFVPTGPGDGYTAGRFRIAKTQPETLATSWTLGSQIQAAIDVAIAARGDHVVAVASTQDTIEAGDFPGVAGALPAAPLMAEGVGVLVVTASPMGELTSVSLLGGASDQIARSVDVASDGRIVVAGCYSERADFEGDCPLPGAADSWDGFVARLDPDGKCIGAERIEMGAADADDCHVRARFDDAGDLYWAAASSGAGGARLEARRDGSASWTWSPELGGSSSATARVTVTAIALDSFGHLLVTGAFGGGLGIATLESSMMEGKGWVAKLAHDPAESQLLWIQALTVASPVTDGVQPAAITVDAMGWVFVAGTADGALALPTVPPDSTGGAFLARLEP